MELKCLTQIDMCNRYHLSDRSVRAMVEKLHVFPIIVDDADVWPTKAAPVAIQRYDVRQHIELMPWGVKTDHPTDSKTLLFARSETVFDKYIWRMAVREQRCLVLASAFWETQCFEIPGDEPMIIAGLYRSWQHGNHRKEGFVMLSAPSVEIVQPYNDRMPLILPESAWEAWFDPQTPRKELESLLQPWSGPLIVMLHPPNLTPRRERPAPLPPADEQMELEL